MRFKEFNILTEKARGLLYRATGDVFKNTQGQEIAFSKVINNPNNATRYNDLEEMDNAVAQAEQLFPNLQWVNKRTNSTLAFIILEFNQVIDGNVTDTNNFYFGKFFKEITSDMEGKWKNSELPGNWQLQKASSLKSSFKLKPIDIFPPESEFETPADLINEMANSPVGAEYAQPTSVMLNNKLPVYPNAKEKLTAIRDDFGEILAPIALVQNMIKNSAMDQAKEDFNNKNDWSGTIKFTGAKNSGLIDSEIILPTGITIGISSKGGKAGASASVKNAYDGYNIIQERVESEKDTKLLEQYANAVSIIETLATSSSIDGPLVLAENFGILGRSETDLIRKLIREKHKDLTNIAATQEQISMLAEFAAAKGANKMHPQYNIGYHILASVADDVAQMVNSDNEINFSEACLKFINANPIIQIYTSASIVNNNDVKIDSFKALYPPNFKGKLFLNSGKVYYATGTNGKYTLEFDKSKMDLDEPGSADDTQQVQEPVGDIKPPSARAKSDKMKVKAGPREKR